VDTKALMRECGRIANEHGFHITWERKEGPMNPIEALAKVMSEASEAIEAYVSQTNNNEWRQEFEEEIADIIIRVFHLCSDLGIDIDRVLTKKMEFNRRRPFRHGKLT